jgi:hypothetical protein
VFLLFLVKEFFTTPKQISQDSSLPSSSTYFIAFIFQTSRMAGEGDKSPAIGIDLGTTYSCVAVWRRDRVEIIVNDLGNRTTPSHVAFTRKERLVGDAAKNQVARNPDNSVFGNLSPSFFFFDLL